MHRIARAGCLVVATLVLGTVAQSSSAQQPPAPSSADAAHGPARPAGQGVAVLAVGTESRDEAFALARAIYGSRLRPASLDEVRARVLAGGAPPANASRELRELAELRAGVTGEDAAGRRLLAGLAQQVGAQALLVVKVEHPAAAPQPSPVDADAGPSWPSFAPPSEADAGAPGNAGGGTTVVARLFLTDSGEFDAARYAPEPGSHGADAWKSTVTSLEGRFPAVSRPPGPNAALRPAPGVLSSEGEKPQPFYTSGWFWGALGAAALIGGAFYFASRGDTGSDPIHLQMRVPK